MKHSTLLASLAVVLAPLILLTPISASPNTMDLLTGIEQSMSSQADYQALRTRWAQGFLGDPRIPFDTRLQTMVITTNVEAVKQWSSMLTDPKRISLWSDLLLDNKSEAGKKVLGANIRASYQRLFSMAKAYRLRDGELQSNTELLAAIIDGMTFINQNYYKVGVKEWGNWWHWELGAPKDIHNILVLLYDNLSPEIITSHTAATRYFTPEATHLGAGLGADVSTNPNYRLSTGGNRTDNTQVIILRGLLDNNSLEIEAAINALSPVLQEVTSGDGFYEDGSFLQHYDIAYNGTYGNVLLSGLGSQLNLVAGSLWEAKDPVLKNIYPIIFKSYAPLLYRGSMMEFVNGRAISRPREQGHNVGHSVIASLLHYIDGAPPESKYKLKNLIKSQIKQDTYLDFFTSINHVGNYQEAKILMDDLTVSDDEQLEGFFNFPSMDRIVFRHDDWAFSLAMHSSRLGNFECMNNENKKGWFTGDGMGYLYNGQLDHYQDFWPAVNSYRLEGTTVDDQLMTACDAQRNQIRGGRKTQMDWVGSVKLGDMGAAGMDFSNWNDTLTAKKSWFMFDEEVVMLGSNIQSSLNANITTTVANRKLSDLSNTKIFVNGKRWQTQANETLLLRTLSIKNSKIDDSNLSYVFLKPTEVTIGYEERQGDWVDIGNHRGEVSANFISTTIQQGPDNDHYAYLLLPDLDNEDVRDLVENMPIKVRRNDKLAHIVIHKEEQVTAAIVWSEQDVQITNQIISSSKMAIMIEKKARKTKIAISDPLQSQTMLKLRFKKPIKIVSDTNNRLLLDSKGNLMIDVTDLEGKSYYFTVK